MIILDVEQGSPEWAAARVGIPTASQFDRILTPKSMKPSASAEKYAWELLAAQILGHEIDGASTGFMARGTILETKAVDYYEFDRDVETEKIGFVLRDDRRVGCSPDRLVGTAGLLEIKVPSAASHIGYLLDDEGIGYKCQVQGQLWLTDRAWCDTISYNPEMPNAIIRQYRDEKFITALIAGVDAFLGMLDEMKIKLITAGHFEPDALGVIPDLRVVA